jgi:hypothetical protein
MSDTQTILKNIEERNKCEKIKIEHDKVEVYNKYILSILIENNKEQEKKKKQNKRKKKNLIVNYKKNVILCIIDVVEQAIARFVVDQFMTWSVILVVCVVQTYSSVLNLEIKRKYF